MRRRETLRENWTRALRDPLYWMQFVLIGTALFASSRGAPTWVLVMLGVAFGATSVVTGIEELRR